MKFTSTPDKKPQYLEKNLGHPEQSEGSPHFSGDPSLAVRLRSILKAHQPFLLLMLSLIGFYFIGLGDYPLIVPDEGRYAEIAREMFSSHNFVTPTLNYFIFFDKPVLYYWLSSFAFYLFGINEFAARFWPAVFAITTSAATYFITAKLYSRRAGLLATVVLSTSPLFWGSGHYANMDLEVAAWITFSLYLFMAAIFIPEVKGRSYLLYASYACAAGAILTKGLIGLAFPMMIIGLWVLLSWRWSILKSMRLGTGLLLTFMLIAPWFYLVQKQNPEFFHYFFYVQQYQRYLTHDFNSQHGFWFYPVIVFAGMLPWVFFLPGALKQSYIIIIKQKQRGAQLFLVIWFVSILLFFSMPASKLAGYILPVLPPLAMLIGIYMAKLWDGDKVYFGKIAPQKVIIFLGILTMTLLLGAKLFLFEGIISRYSIKPLLSDVSNVIKPNTKILALHHYFYDLPFYLKRRVYLISYWDAPGLKDKDSWRGRFAYALNYQKEDRAWLSDNNSLWQFWKSDEQVVAFLTSDILYLFEGTPYKVLAQNKHFMIVTNH